MDRESEVRYQHAVVMDRESGLDINIPLLWIESRGKMSIYYCNG